MTNPNNAVGTPAAFSGRTSVKAFNNITGAYTRGIISGWACAPVSGLTVAVGGNAGTRDIAVAEDASGNRTTISNISEAPIEVVMGSSPATYNRIDAIVAYVEPSPTGDSSTQDNPVACGIIPVAGTAAANPDQPTDAQIRAAITTDGGTGASAYYAVLTIIQRTPGQTTITSGSIRAGAPTDYNVCLVGNGDQTFAVSSSFAEQPLKFGDGTMGSSSVKIGPHGGFIIPDKTSKISVNGVLTINFSSSSNYQFKMLVRAGKYHEGNFAQFIQSEVLTHITGAHTAQIMLAPIVVSVSAGDEIVLQFRLSSETGTAPTTMRTIASSTTMTVRKER